MFSIKDKREISEAVQQILAETNHPELPSGEISFILHVKGAEPWSWANIANNAAITEPSVNPHNENTREPVVPTEEEVYAYLVKLRDSGVTNMWGAAPFLHSQFRGLSRDEANDWLAKWIGSFDDDV